MSRLVTEGIETLRPYEAGKPVEEVAREMGVPNAIKLASNENPFGPSPKAIEAASKVIGEVNRYPDAAAYHLRARIAEKFGVAMEEVIQGNGTNELLELLVRTFTTGDDHMVFGAPSFVVYQIAALSHGVPFTAVPMKDHVHDLDAMMAAVKPNTRLFFIANPNNPTGTYVGRAAIERVLRELPEDVIVVMDEAYFEYVDAEDYPNTLELRDLRKRLVTLRTFSKIYGLAGFRVGYAIGPADMIDYMNRVRAPFNAGLVAQTAALAALDDDEHVRRSAENNRTERARLTKALTEMGLTVVPSQANFVFVDTHRDVHALYDQLLRKGVIIRVFGPLKSFTRITVGSPEENDMLLKALAECLA